jgi:nicotinamide mononucleotide transporter
MDWTEIAAFASGAVCVYLVVRQHIANFAVGIANNLLFVWLFVGAGLYADAGLQVVYIALAGLGWWWWLKGGARRTGVEVHDPSPAALLGCVVAVGVVTAALQWVLLTWTDSSVAGWDALTTALSLVAQFMLSRKWIANWWFWIAADLVYVPLYAHKGLWLTSGLYVLFLGLCVAGLVQWRRARLLRGEQQPEAVAAR